MIKNGGTVIMYANQPVLARSHEALLTVVRGVAPADWQRPTPCGEWNAAQVLQHAAGDQLGYAAFLGEGTGPAEDPFAPSGKLGDEPSVVAEAAVRAAAVAWPRIPADQAEVPVPLPPNTMPAALGVRACALDAAVHAWDIAVATGQPSPLTPELAAELLGAARQFVEPVRAFAFAPVVPAEPGDDAVVELLKYLGRRPDWTA
ncbi:TIGR03086 family metal-binding protein [Streptomyces sp. NPDC048297]|uniref:TIGR03086 family metal-binding protein n=1 Tax=Streptomyces sp. NPDC048297 TaxID=3365531 RepID=UPI003713A12B